MKLLRLFGRGFTVSLQRALATRANLAFEVLQTAFGMAAGAGAILVVFTQTDSLAGWGQTETLVLYGAYHVVTGLLDGFVEPNLEWFAGKVTRGELDDLLLQPVPLLFSVSLTTCRPLALAHSLLGGALVVAGAISAGTGVPGMLACVMLLACGAVVAWATRLALAGLAFWAPGLEPSVFYFALWQLGRYPVQIYRPAVRALLTYVIPVAFIATYPARALLHGPESDLIAGGAVVAVVSVVLTSLFWRAGLRRYTSATS